MISSVTTVTTVATLTVGAALGAAATIFLIFLLSTKEIVSADMKGRLKAFGRSLDVGIIPLLIVFSLIVALKVLEILGFLH
jgi:hypothetical protein